MSISLPPILGWYASYQHQEAIAIVTDTLSEAKIRALGAKNNAAWTVRIAQRSLIILEESTGPVAISLDDVFFLPQNSEIAFQSSPSITFKHHSAMTDVPVRFVLTTGTLSTQVDVYQTGAISYQ